MNESPDSGAVIREYRQLARIVTRSHFGREPSRIAYKPSGLTNYVFAINHVEGQFVIRLSPVAESIDAFKKELWTTQKVRKVGVPTPEVLAVGNKVVPAPYMISRRVSGVEATHHPRKQSIIQEMGRYASLINSVRTNNFGKNFDWRVKKQTNPLSWRDYLEQEWAVEDRFSILEQYNMLLKPQLKALRTITEEVKKISVRPALNHGDLRQKNVIVDDDGEITAIVDWEDCLSTLAPHWDVSIALHDLSIDEKHLFIEGYGLSNEDIEEIAPIVKTFNILNYATTVERAAAKQDQKTLTECKLRLHGYLDLFSVDRSK
jgi:aminoglycoside phosphotransferase (APT) family kinase protein